MGGQRLEVLDSMEGLLYTSRHDAPSQPGVHLGGKSPPGDGTRINRPLAPSLVGIQAMKQYSS